MKELTFWFIGFMSFPLIFYIFISIVKVFKKDKNLYSSDFGLKPATNIPPMPKMKDKLKNCPVCSAEGHEMERRIFTHGKLRKISKCLICGAHWTLSDNGKFRMGGIKKADLNKTIIA